MHRVQEKYKTSPMSCLNIPSDIRRAQHFVGGHHQVARRINSLLDPDSCRQTGAALNGCNGRHLPDRLYRMNGRYEAAAAHWKQEADASRIPDRCGSSKPEPDLRWTAPLLPLSDRGRLEPLSQTGFKRLVNATAGLKD